MTGNIKKGGRFLRVSLWALGLSFVGLRILAKVKQRDYLYQKEPKQQNPMEGKAVVFVEDLSDVENADGSSGHLEAVGEITSKTGIYDRYVKRAMDLLISFGGLILLAPVYLAIAVAIQIDDPGPVFFAQKRVGKNKRYFKLHKFRSMKMAAPHDVPTHMLKDPDQYITKTGKFLRAHSLDELPQLWDIFVGNMSLTGPRPALWNQDLLTAERDRYQANQVKPGLTGWAQINGRDAVTIADKARLDGVYVEKESLWFDLKCLLGTVSRLAGDTSVVEGGTGRLAEEASVVEGRIGHLAEEADLIGSIGFGEPVEVDRTAKKKVLITGTNSYLGESFQTYAALHYKDNFTIESIDLKDEKWEMEDFSSYDVVLHVAGIAHADTSHVSKTFRKTYYAVNTKLALAVARKAKREGVETFVLMSSMIVYGESAPYGKHKVVDEQTVPKPANFYGDSKLQADVAVRKLANDQFRVIVLRPPMIYGRGSKGNYRTLARLAKKLPVFLQVDNQRSMLHVDNFCELLCQIMLLKRYQRQAVVLLPQNREWVQTSQMVKEIAWFGAGKGIRLVTAKSLVWLAGRMPGKVGNLVNKAFGNECYQSSLSEYEGISYQKWNLKESIQRTETKQRFGSWKASDGLESYSVLMSVYEKEKVRELEESIESMLKQTVLCEQFVIVEDGPLPEELEGLIRKYEQNNPNLFTIVRLPKNLGLGKALDQGLLQCRNDLVARMDADDISLPQRCEKLLQLYQENTHLSLAGTDIDEFYDDPSNVVSSRIVPADYASICKFMRRRSPFNHPTVMFRKSEVLRVGGYGKMRRKQDLDLFARMLNQDCYALNINEPLLLFRSDADNYKRRKSWEYCKSYIEVEKANYQRGYCSLIDLAVVSAGQCVLYASPMWLMKFLSDHFLRKEKR